MKKILKGLTHLIWKKKRIRQIHKLEITDTHILKSYLKISNFQINYPNLVCIFYQIHWTEI